MSNRLANEASPYLRDHAENPVDWYPWGEEALGKAKAENKPIFLSIGYSACHWCHVMARESFSDPKIAEILNANYVSIKVDREERPDIDEVYIEAVRILTGSAGWPLSVFLTPELKPFYGGTYFPPGPRPGMAAFNRVLLSALHFFRTQRHEIDEAANRIAVELNRLSSLPDHEGEMDETPLRGFYKQRLEVFDSEHGGFGVAPKFPNPTDLALLLRLSGKPGAEMHATKTRSTRNEADSQKSASFHPDSGFRGSQLRDSGGRPEFEQARAMVELTLHKMAEGGIYDQLGGGFHRYSTDTIWLVPHFEKMLYDNALLAQTYARAFQATGEESYRSIAVETLGWMEREMLLPEGGFAASLDADTGGREGAYYTWTEAQVAQAVGPDLTKLACDFYGVSAPGNFDGTNVLHTAVPIEQVVNVHHVALDELWPKLGEIRARLLAARGRRPALRRDDKVLADWNGLTLSALARCSNAFANSRYLDLARALADFILNRMVSGNEVAHLLKTGATSVPGQLPDFAFVVQGLLDIYDACYDARYVEAALGLSDRMLELFFDQQGGFFTTRADAGLLSRIKNGYDGATPSGNSVAVMNLLRLARLCGRNDYERAAAATLRRFYRTMVTYPPAFSLMLAGLDLLLHPGTEVVLFLPESSSDADAMAALLASTPDDYRTAVVIKARQPDVLTGRLIPLTHGRAATDNKPTAFVCRNQTCFAPVHTGADLARLLGCE
ncbi:thioredoxin domain-containing protein [candidate division WOR-3 bacterium]|uniref:Thioredoxin domain-containing protein n=1 Tax=candidate division WOR-3 bacterium TaxID=2052148 RepID=A0A938BSD6_UNCW3|nr:thioredoxin domain-containing protein [candidate division WOR-3 bacterium]